MIVDVNDEIDEELADGDPGRAASRRSSIRSVLTCASRRGVCAKCYGRDLATGRLVELGLAVGVIAAQSIGEPGTQLTMRTFHIGGTASRVSEQSTLDAKHAGTVRYEGLQVVETERQRRTSAASSIVMNRSGSLVVQDDKGRDRERYPIVYGARLKVRDGQKVEQGQILVEWDPYTFSILTEDAGTVKFKDIIDGVTVHEEVDEVTGLSRLIIVDSPDEKKQPTIEIARQDRQGRAQVPHAVARAPDGRRTARRWTPGDVLAKIPRETTKTKDITGGLPRVVELFEARKPRETGGHLRNRRHRQARRHRQGSAQDPHRPGRRRRAARVLAAARRARQRPGRRPRPRGRAADGRSEQPARHPARCSARRNCRSTWSTKSRRSTGCRASTSTTSTSRSSSGR